MVSPYSHEIFAKIWTLLLTKGNYNSHGINKFVMYKIRKGALTSKKVFDRKLNTKQLKNKLVSLREYAGRL